ncbi:hypothetical protein BU17DRAFT_42891 [Hysterangium stoloniferum]|nr:hypothetical protein BU17DRAFT_42891 [Hysterangium stoloniferum]
MSRPNLARVSSDPIVIEIPGARPTRSRPFQPLPETSTRPRGASITNTIAPAVPKLSRTSKTSQRHVVLPSEPQTQPLPDEVVIPTQAGRSEGERMSKEERQRSGYSRLTAYSVAEGIRMKHLAPFLKREHGVLPRIFDEAIYVVYHLPLLPGYAGNVNVRSSAPTHGKAILSRMSEAEEYGYEGRYFPDTEEASNFNEDGYISSSPNMNIRPPVGHRQRTPRERPEDQIGEAVFFSYGVAVFFGFSESQERDILDDLDEAEAWIRMRLEDDWEIEECHYVHDSTVEFPRIYNDFFTLRSRSHLLSLSVAHALAQSTLLAHYETLASRVVLNPSTTQIPKELATTGSLKLTRGDALRLTGKLFKLRTDINLVSNVLDVPELFWSEASLKGLYDAMREYLEIGPRVTVLNERLSVANDLLDLIHDHVNSGAMHRITWIIIWLIVVACLVELGEVLARVVVHTGASSSIQPVATITPEDALRAVHRLMMQES